MRQHVRKGQINTAQLARLSLISAEIQSGLTLGYGICKLECILRK